MERFKVIPAVFVAITKEDKVLLLRRANTGWLDGYYETPSGHLEEGETLQNAAVRELEEETSLVADPEGLRLIHVYQNYHNSDRPYIGYVFEAERWEGEPQICEPEKCDSMDFFRLNNLPKVTPYVKAALGSLASKEVTLSYWVLALWVLRAKARVLDLG